MEESNALNRISSTAAVIKGYSSLTILRASLSILIPAKLARSIAMSDFYPPKLHQSGKHAFAVGEDSPPELNATTT
jgi:hypothetical protein